MPHQASDGNLFFDRDELTTDTADIITHSDSTVASGPSGAGKTSLMNAAVIPRLERQEHAVITIRPLACGQPEIMRTNHDFAVSLG